MQFGNFCKVFIPPHRAMGLAGNGVVATVAAPLAVAIPLVGNMVVA